MATRPRLSVRAVVIDDGHLLLSRYEDDRGQWHVVPGGGVEHGETIEEAFARETREECGRSLPMGEVMFIREIITDRHDDTNLPQNFHQIEIFVRSSANRADGLQPTEPDTDQIDLIWQPLAELDKILFFPIGLTENFKNQDWPTTYVGEMR